MLTFAYVLRILPRLLGFTSSVSFSALHSVFSIMSPRFLVKVLCVSCLHMRHEEMMFDYVWIPAEKCFFRFLGFLSRIFPPPSPLLCVCCMTHHPSGSASLSPFTHSPTLSFHSLQLLFICLRSSLLVWLALLCLHYVRVVQTTENVLKTLVWYCIASSAVLIEQLAGHTTPVTLLLSLVAVFSSIAPLS